MKHKILIWIIVLGVAWVASLFIFPLFRASAEAPMLSPEQQYEAELEVWLDRLQWDESNNNKMLVILDTNNKYSYGCLQFQMATWIEQSKKYNVEKEIMDCETQRYVAKQMIKSNWNNWRHWYTSVTKKTSGKPPVFNK